MSTLKYAVRPRVNMLYVREDDPAAVEAAAAAAAAAALEAEVAKRVQTALDTEVKGLKEKNTELLGKLREASDKAKSLDGLDIPKLREMQERLEKDEDAKLFAEGKANVVIDKYTQRMRERHENEMKTKDLSIKEQREIADRYRASVLDNQIRTVTTGLHKGAVEDALLLARTIFSLDDKGNAVKMDSEGRPEIGKDGVSPFSPAEWIELQKELKPHWFPAGSSGSGSSGAGAGSGGKTMSRANFDRLPGTDQVKLVRSGIKIID